MPCPTCSHSMQNVGVNEDDGPMRRRVFWCPRCGTLREEISNATGCQTNDDAPKLVGRCREFEEQAPHGVMAMWKRIGVAEAINPPPLRPE